MGFWPVSIRATVGYQAAQVRTEGSGITTGGFGFHRPGPLKFRRCTGISRLAWSIRRDSAARGSARARRMGILKARLCV